jgi:ketosteroid isomerase-like protein
MPLFEPAAVKTVKAWFAAHARGDLEAARALFAPDGMLNVTSPDPATSGGAVGFDGFIDWYARRSTRVAQFSFRLDDLIGNDRRAVAVLTLRDESHEWRQVAVYEVTDRRITEIWVFEGGP